MNKAARGLADHPLLGGALRIFAEPSNLNSQTGREPFKKVAAKQGQGRISSPHTSNFTLHQPAGLSWAAS